MLGLFASLTVLMTAQVPVEPEAIRDDFIRRVEQCGRQSPFTPDLVALTTPGMIFYDLDSRTVVYPVWASLTDEMKTFILSPQERAGSEGEAAFTDRFQRLLVAHELGHWLETMSEREISHWDSELQANRIMVAYWRVAMNDDAALEARLSRMWTVLDHQESPVPQGREVSEYFNAAPFDPSNYGWYQAVMVREAWGRRDEAGFCGLVEEAWPSA